MLRQRVRLHFCGAHRFAATHFAPSYASAPHTCRPTANALRLRRRTPCGSFAPQARNVGAACNAGLQKQARRFLRYKKTPAAKSCRSYNLFPLSGNYHSPSSEVDSVYPSGTLKSDSSTVIENITTFESSSAEI